MALLSDPMNLGPLTTVFTAPLACSTDALYVNNNRDCAGSVSVLRGPVATSSGGRCFPPGFDGRAGAYYSPGLCPRGYTVACTSVIDTAPPDLAETVLTCCPQAAQGLTYGCSAGPEWSWGGCHATLGGATATLTGATTVECGTTRDAGPDFIWDGVAQAQSVQVRFRAGDESLFETGRDTTPATTPSSPDRTAPATGSTEPVARASSDAQEAAEGAGSPPAAHPALVAVAASCSAVIAVAIAVAALLFVRARRVARELRERETQIGDRFYHATKPSRGGGDGDGDGDMVDDAGTVITVTALGGTATPTTSPAPVVVVPVLPAPPTPAFGGRPPDVSPLSVAGARLAYADADVTTPAELGTAPQYEMEGSPVVRPQRGRQAPFPPPPPPLVQTASPTVGKAVTTQELSPVSEA